MKNLVIGIILNFVVFTGVLLAQKDIQNIISKADLLYNKKDLQAKGAKESLSLLEKALNSYPDNFEILWRLARACFWICDRTENEDVKKEYGKKGYQYAEKAIKLNPNRVEGYYYYAICLGEYGKGISIIKAVWMGLDKDFKNKILKAIELDKNYEHAGPVRALGRFYFKLPWPKYSAKKSIKYLKEAIELAPRKARSYYYLAETYVEEKMWKDAYQTLNKIFSIKPYQDDITEYQFYKEKASQLLEKVRKHYQPN